MRSKSKQADREFILWIPEPLDDLENIIQSKQRTLDLLNYQTETLDKEIQDQLLARDRHISDLNRTILDLKSTLKAKEPGGSGRNLEKELESQEKQMAELRKENLDLSDKLRNVTDKFDKARRLWEQEKENLEILNNALEEEGEGLKGSVEAKELEITDTFQALNTLQTAVEKFTRLNSDLLGNVDKVNNEIKNLNTKLYEANLKAARATELERTVQEYINQNYEKDVRIAKLMMYPDALGRYMKVTEWVLENLKVLEDHARDREESLSKVTEDNVQKAILDLKIFLQDTVTNVNTIRTSLRNSNPTINSEDRTTEDILRKKIIELEQDLKDAHSEQVEIKSKESVYIENIQKLQNSLEKLSLEYQANLSKMNNQVEILKESTDKFNERIEKLAGDNEKFLNEIYTLKSKLAHLSGKQEHFQKKRKEFQEIEEELRTENMNLKQKLLNIDPARAALRKNSTAEELRVKKAMSQLQILREELFRKDTELVRKAREMVKLEKEIETEKGQKNKMHGKIKTIEAEIISKVSQDLEEKDRQIEILKEMLRCAHSDIKLKETQLNNIRNTERMTSPKRK